ncbi:hypothetical protein KP509_01G023500 [Ceratopteris richardii]|uniref:Uncharacterized protein n=1 Tax=Ceratopteris richardii TaxID=49495 RepID=A0A8T2VBC5_CERRI|nr:hypothetical protein KP509_01G023500 [Ceratopteris richardii]
MVTEKSVFLRHGRVQGSSSKPASICVRTIINLEAILSLQSLRLWNPSATSMIIVRNVGSIFAILLLRPPPTAATSLCVLSSFLPSLHAQPVIC